MDSKYGYINTEGELVIDCQFHKCGNFDNGYAWVKNNESEFALIDKKGKIVIYRAIETDFDKINKQLKKLK